MKHSKRLKKVFISAVVATGYLALFAGTAQAHCDSTHGPIIPEAKSALAKGDVTSVLKWVPAKDEAEIKSSFARAVAVRGLGGAAEELADQYFLETLVRIHRASEGAPYTGISDTPVNPINALTDAALEQGAIDKVSHSLTTQLEKTIREKFNKVVQAAAEKDKSVEAGRRFTAAYVDYTHYVEGVHAAIKQTAGDQHSASASEAHSH